MKGLFISFEGIDGCGKTTQINELSKWLPNSGLINKDSKLITTREPGGSLLGKKLRKLILSEETRPWKFLTKNIYLDLNRVNLDTNLLKKFYKNIGYFNVEIKSSYAKVKDNKDFDLTF